MKLQLLAASAIASQAAFGEQARKITPPAAGPIPVAFVITEGATMIDFAGPWEVFQDVMVGDGMPFRLYTVSDSKAPLRSAAGCRWFRTTPSRTRPPPRIVVVGAQSGSRRRCWDGSGA